jgi:hypothetical protein
MSFWILHVPPQDEFHLATFNVLAFLHAMMHQLILLQCLFTAPLVSVWAIIVTVPAEGDKYSLDPGPSALEWRQERLVNQRKINSYVNTHGLLSSGDPSECDVWLQHVGGDATYFSHVVVSSCRLDFSSWANSTTLPLTSYGINIVKLLRSLPY